MSAIFTAIAGAVEEQAAATNGIARNIQEAAVGTRSVSNAIGIVSNAVLRTGSSSRQVLGAANELGREAQALKAEVERFLAGIRAA